MASKKISLLVGLLLVAQSAAFSIKDLSRLIRRTPFNVGRFASIGESFASGPSAGDPYDKVTKCRRYTKAQGPQVAADNRIQGQKTFDFIACSGSKLKNIYQDSTGGGDAPGDKPKISQAGALAGKNPDLVTMSIGGNDVGFVDLLDRCVYRFYDVGGCRGCGVVVKNDCTDDCNEAINAVQAKIDSVDFTLGLHDAIRAIFQNAPRTKLFVTGYPRFWNADTAACDKVSFKFGCINNSVLPLIKDRRAKMNRLTDNLNAKIRNVINNWPTSASLTFVDPNPFFEGHRFCEQGVSEPSYRNDNIFFYPFEYWTGGTLNINANAAGDCQALLNNGEDQGVYFACEMANEAKAGNIVDLSKQPNNVNGAVTITSSDSLPDFLARIFHPTIKGMTAYRDAIVSAYNAYEGDTGGGATGQQIAVASYINPLGSPASWERLISYDSKKVSVLVANVLNGPDYLVEPNWKSVIDRAANQGKKIIGYVRTGYLGVSQQHFTTRLGSSNLADWASQIQQDIDKWYELYGTNLGGIFFDEGWPECGPNNIYANLYKYINNYTKRKYPGAFTVLNPGSPIAQCYEDTMDTLLTFENSIESYKNSFVPNDWTPKDPRKIWHIIYRVPQDQIATVAALALSRKAGLIEITDDDNPNPYDDLPNEAYMQAAIGAVSGGKLNIAEADNAAGSYVAGLPSNAAVSFSDYTSVTLTWSAVGNALGYGVYLNGRLRLELPPSLTRATIGMLEPGSSLSLEVRTILASGGGGSSRMLTASTKSLPSSGPITNCGNSKSGDTVTYHCDVLVPFAFVRLFLSNGKSDTLTTKQYGWPIRLGYPISFLNVMNYLIEGNEFYSGFYKYSGTWWSGSLDNAEWSWTPIGTAPQVQKGYTYTWTVPWAGVDAALDKWIVQGQGYAPLANVGPS